MLEYVNVSNTLLSLLNYLLTPGGYILSGTPNAANIDLTRPDVSNHYNSIYAPYHFNLYTAKPLESLGSRQEREAVSFFDRLYYNLFFVLNTPAWNKYQRLLDGTLNVVLEPILTWKALTSYKDLFYTLSGYWLSFKTYMNLMLCKSF